MGVALGWSAIYFRHLGLGTVGHSLRKLTAVL
jgi:hypothetical protein